MKHDFRTLGAVIAVLLCAVWLTGCTSAFTGKSSATPRAGTTVTQASASTADSRRTAVYYDFEDVLIPVDLSIVQEKSMIVSTPGFTSGILVLRGRVERRSLINFFNTNMQRDNWTRVSQISSPDMAILVFEKPLKSAVISIRSEAVFTYVDVGVAARIAQGALPRNTDTIFQSSDLTQ